MKIHCLVKAKMMPSITLHPVPHHHPPATSLASTPAEHEVQLKTALHTATSLPPELPIKETIGKPVGLMCPQSPYCGHHPAIPLLNGYASTGFPVDCGPDWDRTQIELLFKRGPHHSATSREEITQLRTETEDKCKHVYAHVVTWGALKNEVPKRLKISLVAMIPHKSKPFRCILDLLFTLQHKCRRYSSFNTESTPLSLPQSMVQLGTSIHCLIHMMAWHYAPNNPFKFAKLDIADGFWLIVVNNTDAWNFCYVLPALHPLSSLDEAEIIVPNSLQMGWCESPPPFFLLGL